ADVLLRGKVVESATSGAILGEMAIIDNSPRAATVVAREDCSLIAINAPRFSALTREMPDFALHVMRAMADRLRRVGKLL
ncbi:MAG: cyclic nucleotide-binding domain-containing protein, partial [Betaproteobacteria bacterium]